MTGPPEANDGLVPWERLAAGIPPLDLPRDLRHGIAHLSFLVATDESLRRGLGPHWQRGLGRVAPSTARRLAPTLRPIGPDPVATVPDGAMTVRLGGWAMGIRNGHLVQVGGDGPLDPVATRPGESIERCIDRLVAHHELPAAEHRLLTSWHLAAGGSGFVELTCLLLFAAVPDHVRAAKVPEIVSRGYTPPPHDPERPPVVTLYDTLRHGLREVAIQVDEGDLRLPPEWRGPLAAFWEPDPARHALAARRAVGIYGYEQGL
jgi:hypothetical protein